MEKPVYQLLDTALMVAATTFVTLFAKVKHLLLIIDILIYMYIIQQLNKDLILLSSDKNKENGTCLNGCSSYFQMPNVIRCVIYAIVFSKQWNCVCDA